MPHILYLVDNPVQENDRKAFRQQLFFFLLSYSMAVTLFLTLMIMLIGL